MIDLEGRVPIIGTVRECAMHFALYKPHAQENARLLLTAGAPRRPSDADVAAGASGNCGAGGAAQGRGVSRGQRPPLHPVSFGIIGPPPSVSSRSTSSG
jgi:hypothetical protein